MVHANKIFLIFMLLISGMLAACNTQKDHTLDIAEIYKVLERRAQAVTNRDLKLYDSIIFTEYSSSGIHRDVVLDDLKLTFEKFPDIQLKMPRIRPDVKLQSARIMQTAYYRAGIDSPVVEIKETLMFRRVKGQWYISAGIVMGLANRLKIKG